MEDSKVVWRKEFTLGDAAVDGLLAGIVAGIVMAAYLVLWALVAGEGPGTVLGRFDPGAEEPLRGVLMHLAVSAVYGTLFGLAWRTLTRGVRKHALIVFAGLAYGAALFAAGEGIILPVGPSPLLAIPAWSFGVAHLIYGMTLGLVMGQFNK